MVVVHSLSIVYGSNELVSGQTQISSRYGHLSFLSTVFVLLRHRNNKTTHDPPLTVLFMANPTHPNRQKTRQTNETAAAIDHRYISFVRNCSKMDSTPHPKKMFVRKLIGLICLTIGSISLYQLHHTKSIDSNIGYGTIPLFSAAILTPLQTCLGV